MAEAVQRWAALNEGFRSPDGFPDRNAEYLLYQVMVGAWPLARERARQYIEKAAREAKVYTSWRDNNPEYEMALAGFIEGIYSNRPFLNDLERFVQGITEPGWINSLAQTLLKITSPGVPDFYQGAELWDFSLVDPDNRRPVDYETRRRLLSELRDDTPPEDIWARAAEGLPKLWLIRQALGLRRRRPEIFGPQGIYTPLYVLGERALAFTRGEGGALVIVPRLPHSQRALWPQTSLNLPRGVWRNLLTHETLEDGNRTLDELFARFPAALLEKVE